ncbi:MAG TPA: hypothetical protein PLJ29_11205, partial [Leptospiraceae bacterium]|nr:hypothetical protein [Leptospiraceae bacterium]
WAISSLFRTFNESKPQGIITNPVNVLVFTVFLAKYLRPTPKTYMDDVSQKHDDEAPNPLGEMYGKKDSEQQTNASFNFVTRADAGLYSGKIRTAEDLGVHLVGRTAYYYYGQLRLGMWAVQSMYDELKVGCSKLLGGHRCGKVR